MIWWIILALCGPIVLYILIRLVFAAIFRSYFDEKKIFLEDKKEDFKNAN
jgi:hypothetical protein